LSPARDGHPGESARDGHPGESARDGHPGESAGGMRWPTRALTFPDVLVVGAGPAGSTAARLLAEGGLDVEILEEHAEVGTPVHCTGLVGEEVFRDFDVPRALVSSRLERFRVVAPGGGAFDLPRAGAYALDRRALDVFLANQAVLAGARLSTGVKVRSVENLGDRVRVVAQSGHAREARLCVLACGAMSNLPARSGIIAPRTYFRTVQANFENDGLEGAEIYLGRDVAAGSFGYAAATGCGVKVGVIARGVARHGYERLLRRMPGLRRVTADTYRRIPMGACRKSVAERVLAVGDAAGQTKTTTGGGIYYAMLCARMLAETVLQSRRGSDFSLRLVDGYDAAWRRRLGLEIQGGLWLRGFFEHVGDDEVDRLVAVAASPPVQDVFLREWDFDFHHRLLVGLARLPELRRHCLGTLRGRRVLGAILAAVDLRPTFSPL